MIDFTDPAHSDLNLPQWAQPLRTTRRAEMLIQIAAEVITHRYEKPAIDRSRGQLKVDDAQIFRLTNMAHTAAQLPENQWRMLAYDMISTLDEHSPEQIAAMLSDWEQIRDTVRVRVFPGQTDSMGWHMVGRNLGPDSHLGMGVQLHRSMVQIPSRYADRWDIGLDTAWATANSNRDAQVPVTVSSTKLADHATGRESTLVMVDGEGLAVTGHAVNLNSILSRIPAHQPATADHPYAVMCPTAHSVLVQIPVEPDETLSPMSVGAMRELGQNMATFLGNAASQDVFRYTGPDELSYAPEWNNDQGHETL